MKIRNVNLQVLGMSDFLYTVLGNKSDDVLDASKVYSKYTFGDCDYSLVPIEDFINCFSDEDAVDLWNEIKVHLNLAGDEDILPEDVANLYVDLAG